MAENNLLESFENLNEDLENFNPNINYKKLLGEFLFEKLKK